MLISCSPEPKAMGELLRFEACMGAASGYHRMVAASNLVVIKQFQSTKSHLLSISQLNFIFCYC